MTDKQRVLNHVLEHGRVDKYETADYFNDYRNGKVIATESTYRYLRMLAQKDKDGNSIIKVSDDKRYYSVPWPKPESSFTYEDNGQGLLICK